MWISNSAATAMLMPIAFGLFREISRDAVADSKQLNPMLLQRVLLSTAFSASIGGIATPIGSPPNAIAISYLDRSNIDLSFLEWMLRCLPLSLVMLITMNLILASMIPVYANKKEITRSEKSRIDLSKESAIFEPLPKLNSNRFRVLIIFFLAILMWVGPSFLALIFSEKIWASNLKSCLPMGVVAVISASFLFFIPDAQTALNSKSLIDWEDARKIDWGTVMLFGGGLCLSRILDNSGLSGRLGNYLFTISGSNILTFVFLFIVVCILFSEFSSNTASASIMIPIVVAISKDASQLQGLLLTTAIAASFGFMLPVSTPPNAIIFGTGEIPLRYMMRVGVYFDLLGAFLIWIWFAILL